MALGDATSAFVRGAIELGVADVKSSREVYVPAGENGNVLSDL